MKTVAISIIQLSEKKARRHSVQSIQKEYYYMRKKRCSAYEEYIRVDDNCDMKKINEALEDKGFN